MNVFDKKIFNDCAGFGITETPSFYLTIEPVVDTETLFGKQVSELQTGVATNSGEVVGTLNYVIGYTGFSGDPALQSGHFLALKATAQSGTVISATLVGGSGKIVTLDDDGMIVFRITSTTQKVQFMATKDGETYTMTLPLTNVTLAPLNFNLQVVPAIDTDGSVGGKVASDLQENVVFGERVTGTLKYVSGYASFTGDNQNGHFLMLKATAIQGATVTAEVLFYAGQGSQVVYGTDGLIVCRLESNSEEIAITATINGQSTTQRLSLYLEYAPQPQPTGLTPFYDGTDGEHSATIINIGDYLVFDTTFDMDTYLASIVPNNGDTVTLCSAEQYPLPEGGEGGAFLMAMNYGGVYMLVANSLPDMMGYSSEAISEQGIPQGWFGLTNGKYEMSNQGIKITGINTTVTGWNGVFAGWEQAN